MLGRFGIRIVGRSQRLTLNYRTTAETLRYAVGMLEGGSYVDMEEAPEDARAYRSARRGPAPRLVEVGSITEELDVAAGTVRGWLADGVVPETIGLLVRGAQHAGRLARGLDDRGVAVRQVDGPLLRPGCWWW